MGLWAKEGQWGARVEKAPPRVELFVYGVGGRQVLRLKNIFFLAPPRGRGRQRGESHPWTSRHEDIRHGEKCASYESPSPRIKSMCRCLSLDSGKCLLVFLNHLQADRCR